MPKQSLNPWNPCCTPWFRAALAVALSTLAPAVPAHEYYTKSFIIVHPWALPSQPNADSAAVYVRFDEISASDKLVSANSLLAQSVELRRAKSTGAEATNTATNTLNEIAIDVGASVELKPESNHLVLKGLRYPLLWGRSYPMTLVFEKSGPIMVMISIGAH